MSENHRQALGKVRWAMIHAYLPRSFPENNQVRLKWLQRQVPRDEKKMTFKHMIFSWKHSMTRAWRNACDHLKWLGYKPSNLERHAEHELRLAGWFDEDAFYGEMMGRAVLRMIREFSEEGHSGMSAPTAIGLFEKVARFGVLTPLTGEDGEWKEIDEGLWQNRRCGNVFKDADGRAYDSTGRIFREPSGVCYASRDSRVYITFPYVPRTEYVDVDGSTS